MKQSMRNAKCEMLKSLNNHFKLQHHNNNVRAILFGVRLFSFSGFCWFTCVWMVEMRIIAHITMLMNDEATLKRNHMNLCFVRCAVRIHLLDQFWCNETLNCASNGLGFKSKQTQCYFNRNRIKTIDDAPYNIFFNVLELKTFLCFGISNISIQ